MQQTLEETSVDFEAPAAYITNVAKARGGKRA